MADRRLIWRWVCSSVGVLLILFIAGSAGHTAALVWSKAARNRPKSVKAATPAKKTTTGTQSSKKRASSARIATTSRGKQSQTTSSSKKKKPTSRRRRVSAARPGSRIPPERVVEIQNALISRGYLQGPPSGAYDGNTVAAMKKFQQAESLDATGYPTARVLNRLGLPPGPGSQPPGILNLDR